MKNMKKTIFVLFLQIFIFGVLLFGNFSVAKADGAPCSPACVAPQVCGNGSCVDAAHSIAPDAPVLGGLSQIKSNTIPGSTTEGSDIIKCGRPGQQMCTLCNLIEGLNNIIQYLMKIAIGVALLAFSIGGLMYAVSAGDSGLIDNAKAVMKNAAIGFVLIFAAYLIINTTIEYIGSKTTVDAAGVPQPTFGMNIVSWGKFECAAQTR